MEHYESKGYPLEQLLVPVHEKDLYVHIQERERGKSQPPRVRNTLNTVHNSLIGVAGSQAKILSMNKVAEESKD